MLDEGIHRNSSINWNLDVDLSKNTHRKVERKKVNIEDVKATFLIFTTSELSINRTIIAPNKGIKMIDDNK